MKTINFSKVKLNYKYEMANPTPPLLFLIDGTKVPRVLYDSFCRKGSHVLAMPTEVPCICAQCKQTCRDFSSCGRLVYMALLFSAALLLCINQRRSALDLLCSQIRSDLHILMQTEVRFSHVVTNYNTCCNQWNSGFCLYQIDGRFTPIVINRG